jgi:hypothetical protein
LVTAFVCRPLQEAQHQYRPPGQSEQRPKHAHDEIAADGAREIRSAAVRAYNAKLHHLLAWRGACEPLDRVEWLLAMIPPFFDAPLSRSD